MRRRSGRLALLFAVSVFLGGAPAGADDPPDEVGPKLVIAGGGLNSKILDAFRELAGPDPKLVVVPTASEGKDPEKVREQWMSRGYSKVIVLDATDRSTASSWEFVKTLQAANAVWFGGGYQRRLAEIYVGTAFEEALYELLARGGVIGGSSAGAAIQTKVMIGGGYLPPVIVTGLDLLPGAIVDQHFLERDRIARLMEAVRTHPDRVGFGIDERTALVVSDNEARVVGNSYVIRVEAVDGEIRLNAYNEGETVPLP